MSGLLTICLLLVCFVSAAGCHCFDLTSFNNETEIRSIVSMKNIQLQRSLPQFGSAEGELSIKSCAFSLVKLAINEISIAD